MKRLDKFTFKDILLNSVSSFEILTQKEQNAFKKLGAPVYARIQVGFQESPVSDKETFEKFLSKLADYQEEVLKHSAINTADQIQKQTDEALKTLQEQENKLIETNNRMLAEVKKAMQDTSIFQEVVSKQLTELNVNKPIIEIAKKAKTNIEKINEITANIQKIQETVENPEAIENSLLKAVEKANLPATIRKAVKPLVKEISALKSTNDNYKQSLIDFKDETDKVVKAISSKLETVKKSANSLIKTLDSTENQWQQVFDFGEG